MPARMPPEQPQPTISSFFQPSQRSTSGKRAASPIRVDLTGDSDGERPAKKVKRSAAARVTPESPTSTGGGAASQWSYTPVSPDKSETSTAPKQRSEADVAAAKKRRDAFTKKLLLENNRFIQTASVPDRASSPVEEPQNPGSADEDSDNAFKELSLMFSNSKKAKGKAKAAPAKQPKNKQPAVIGPGGKPYTPLELQVLQLKRENPGTLLMIAVGYKYRFFGDDAKAAATELGMVAFNDRNFLVASIPLHRRNVHLKNLLSKGYRVGIVDQVETAALKKVGDNRNAPFERKLVHLFTAATYVDDLDSVDDLERYSPPPFFCLVEESSGTSAGDVSIGMITICPSTGDVVWDDFQDTLMRIELEVRTSSSGDRIRTEHWGNTMTYTDAFESVSSFYTDKTKAAAASESFKSGRLMAEVADFPKRVVIALAHAIKYLSAFSIADAFLETRFFSKFTTKAHMLLAANTLTNLEIYRNETDHTTKGSLLQLLDKTKTNVLQDRIDAVEEIRESASEQLVTIRQILRKLPDLAKGLCRIQYGQCTPQELAILFPAFNKIAVAFEEVGEPSDVGFKSSLLNEIIFSFPKLKNPMKELMEAVSLTRAAEGRMDTMWTDPERYPAIADADVAIQHVEVELDGLLKDVRKTLKYPSLNWTTFDNDEYIVQVKIKENRPIPDDWILHSNLALVAFQENYVRPTFTEDDTLEIVNGRHPMVEEHRHDPFIPNTIMMGGGHPRSKIITGPNMGGKSSCVRMIALIAIMAQIGSYVPAESVKMGLLDSMAIADAVMEQLVTTTKSKTLFITHYPLVASNLEARHPLEVENLHMGFQEDSRIDGTREITFLYRLTPGMASGK
ncbi:hypothetical protein DXG03_001095 [Asterophora parasitica]|uniref:DNA mismatch repair protein MSH3 n=1 Tax=Asterophora parasitica TaxID=117018 RepID=A0A9P7GGY9_9AGAR|nr:hypothetical protein DXG03_001095 [Asterophora parasitica]